MNMREATWAVAEECARGSLAGTMHFGEVVGKLVAAGVESYHADYRRAEITYYLPSGASQAVRLTEPIAPIAEAFSADSVRAAVQCAQRGDVMYPEFRAPHHGRRLRGLRRLDCRAPGAVFLSPG